jgi:hypothetical protein
VCGWVGVWRGGSLWSVTVTVQAGKRVHDAVDDWMSAFWWHRAHYRGLLEAAIADLEALDPPAGGYAAEELSDARFWTERADRRHSEQGQISDWARTARSVGWVTSD